MSFVSFLCSALTVVAILYACLACFFFLFNRWSYKPCTSKANLRGKTVVITGATAGLGKEAARDFAIRGGRVIIAGRNLKKAQRVKEDILLSYENANVIIHHLDTSELSSVRKFAQEIRKSEKRIDVLCLNAGIAPKETKTFTTDKFEQGMATNHFGHFLLVNLLSELMHKDVKNPGRIVVTASLAHRFAKEIDPQDLNFEKMKYSSWNAYAQTKLCNVLMTRYLAEQFRDKGVIANCLCPGGVATEIATKSDSIMAKLFNLLTPAFAMKTCEEGAQTLIHLAVCEKVKNITGEFFEHCEIGKSSEQSKNSGMAKKLWEASELLVDLKSEEKLVL